MTTPIPEAVVEAAARAAYESLDTLPGGTGGQTLRESWDSISARLREQYVVSTRAALTAARPLMEAEVRGQVAAEIRAVAQDPDRRRPLHIDAGHATDLANDFEWCAQIAATIAERTQR